MAQTIRYISGRSTSMDALAAGTSGVALTTVLASAAVVAACGAWLSTIPTAGILARIVVLYLANTRG